jgi:hypothetical protein
MGRHTKPHTAKLYKPTDDQRRAVLTMTGFGLKQEEIATSLEIDRKTLTKHFRRELDTGMIEANVRVAKALYQNAVQHNNVAAQIWWTKTRMGWKDTSVIENTGDRPPFVIYMPAPTDSTTEWLAQHAPPQIDHEPQPK